MVCIVIDAEIKRISGTIHVRDGGNIGLGPEQVVIPVQENDEGAFGAPGAVSGDASLRNPDRIGLGFKVL